MARGRKLAGDVPPDAPFQIWVAKVNAHNRLRWRKDISLVVPWLSNKQGTIPCVATIGPFGGVQIHPDGGRGASTKRRLLTQLKRVPANADEVADDLIAAARFLATSWAIPIQVDAGRFSLTLPEDARKLRVVPQRQ